MRVDCFLDTNILLYSVSRNQAHHLKKTRAIDLIERQRFGTSVQVMQEFYVNATRNADFAMSTETALEWIEMLQEQPFISVGVSMIKSAAVLSQQHRLSYWDAAIITAAEALGAPIVYSEDLKDGQRYGSVRVINPFTAPGAGPGFHETVTPLS